MAELVRVTGRGGRLLVVDQIAPVDPVAAAELNAFERTRDPSHVRAFADVDLRQLFESNDLVLVRAEYERESRELDSYLDLAGCEGEAHAPGGKAWRHGRMSPSWAGTCSRSS